MHRWRARGGALAAALMMVAGCDAANGDGGGQDTVSIGDTGGASDVADGDAVDADAAPGVDAVPDADPGDTTAPADATADQDTAVAGDTTGGDSAAPADTVNGAACPPAGPYGTQVGDVLADLTLVDCDGNPHEIADLCGRPASLLTAFAGWCPICGGDAAHANADYLAFKAQAADFEWYFVITEPDGANTMSSAYCAAIREDYGLTMPVLLDSAGVFPGHLGVTSTNAWTVALDAAGVILAKDKYDQANAFSKVSAALD